MSDSAKVSITLKAGPGFEVPWIVLYGDTLAEAVALLEQAGGTNIAVLAANAARSFQAQYAATGLGQTTQVNQAAPAPSAAPQAAAPATTSANTTPSCQHGTKVYKEGAPPKTWKAWMCPAAKGTPGQCDPEWIK